MNGNRFIKRNIQDAVEQQQEATCEIFVAKGSPLCIQFRNPLVKLLININEGSDKTYAPTTTNTVELRDGKTCILPRI